MFVIGFVIPFVWFSGFSYVRSPLWPRRIAGAAQILMLILLVFNVAVLLESSYNFYLATGVMDLVFVITACGFMVGFTRTRRRAYKEMLAKAHLPV